MVSLGKRKLLLLAASLSMGTMGAAPAVQAVCLTNSSFETSTVYAQTGESDNVNIPGWDIYCSDTQSYFVVNWINRDGMDGQNFLMFGNGYVQTSAGARPAAAPAQIYTLSLRYGIEQWNVISNIFAYIDFYSDNSSYQPLGSAQLELPNINWGAGNLPWQTMWTFTLPPTVAPAGTTSVGVRLATPNAPSLIDTDAFVLSRVSTWNGDSALAASNASNWIGSAPNGVNDIVNFDTTVAMPPATTELAAAFTIGTMNFNNANKYTLTGAAVTLEVDTGAAAINGVSGSHQIATPLVLASNTGVRMQNAADTLTLSGAISGPGSLSVSGPGTTVLTGSVSYAGPTNVQTGKLVLGGVGQTLTGTLSVDPGAVLDVRQNTLVITGGMNLDTVRDALKAGTSTGVLTTSSAVAGKTGLGYLSGAADLAINQNATVNPTDVVVRYTYLGDASLDGQVTAADFAQLDASSLLGTYASGGAHWINGDFNYDGVVNVTDYAIINAGYFYQENGNALAAARLAAATSRFGAAFTVAYDSVSATYAVPEPSTLALMGLGVVALLRRRR